MLKNILNTALFSALALVASQATAQSEGAIRANSGKIGLATASSTGTYAQIGGDLARVLDGESGLRIVPIISRGSGENLTDLLNNDRLVDIALLTSDSLISARLQDPDNERFNDFRYLAKVYTNEGHVVIRRNSGISSFSDLIGRTVSVGGSGSGTEVTARLILRALGVQANEVNNSHTAGLAALQAGEVDAMFLFAGAPVGRLSRITEDQGLTLLSIPPNDTLRSFYNISTITPEDYPGLVSDKEVTTVGIDVVLAAVGDYPIGSEEFNLRMTFLREIQNNIEELRSAPNHPKWAEFAIDAQVPGWQRAAAAEVVLTGAELATPEGPSIEDIMRQGLD